MGIGLGIKFHGSQPMSGGPIIISDMVPLREISYNHTNILKKEMAIAGDFIRNKKDKKLASAQG